MTDVMINVERMCVAENGVVDVCSCLNCGMEFADKYKHLAAELKQLREFVGAAKAERESVNERLSWILTACKIDRDAMQEIRELLP